MAQVPVDIQRIDEVYSTITSETNSDSIVDAFAKMLRDNARDLAKRSGIYKRGQFGSERFSEFVRQSALAVKAAATVSDRVKRESALYEKLINLSTQNAAYAIIDGWLDLPAAGSLVKPAETVSKSSMGNQIRMSSTDNRLSLVFPTKEESTGKKALNKVSSFFGGKKGRAKGRANLYYRARWSGYWQWLDRCG